MADDIYYYSRTTCTDCGDNKWYNVSDYCGEPKLKCVSCDKVLEGKRAEDMIEQFNFETRLYKHIPEWALYAFEYGCDECEDLTDEHEKMINDFLEKEDLLSGYHISYHEEGRCDFDRYPEFGLPTSTIEVEFLVPIKK